MTPVDAYDLFLILGMDKEAKEAKELIIANLNFNRDMEVQFFEVVIRLEGGLLAAYGMDHDPRLLNLANELGRRLLSGVRIPDRNALPLCQPGHRENPGREEQPC